jgi:hypothetical protein
MVGSGSGIPAGRPQIACSPTGSVQEANPLDNSANPIPLR